MFLRLGAESHQRLNDQSATSDQLDLKTAISFSSFDVSRKSIHEFKISCNFELFIFDLSSHLRLE